MLNALKINRYQLNTNFYIENILHLKIFRKNAVPEPVAQLLTWITSVSRHIYKNNYLLVTKSKTGRNQSKVT